MTDNPDVPRNAKAFVPLGKAFLDPGPPSSSTG